MVRRLFFSYFSFPLTLASKAFSRKIRENADSRVDPRTPAGLSVHTRYPQGLLHSTSLSAFPQHLIPVLMPCSPLQRMLRRYDDPRYLKRIAPLTEVHAVIRAHPLRYVLLGRLPPELVTLLQQVVEQFFSCVRILLSHVVPHLTLIFLTFDHLPR